MTNNNGGNGKRAARLTKWTPQTWKPVYDQMVAMSLQVPRIPNKDIAKVTGYTEAHVSNVLHTPQASLIRRQIYEELRSRLVKRIPDQLEEIALKTTERLHALVHDDDKFDASPFAVVDRGMKVMTSLGHLKDDKKTGDIKVDKAIILTGKHTNDLYEGIKKAREVELLHSGPEIAEDASDY